MYVRNWWWGIYIYIHNGQFWYHHVFFFLISSSCCQTDSTCSTACLLQPNCHGNQGHKTPVKCYIKTYNLYKTHHKHGHTCISIQNKYRAKKKLSSTRLQVGPHPVTCMSAFQCKKGKSFFYKISRKHIKNRIQRLTANGNSIFDQEMKIYY